MSFSTSVDNALDTARKTIARGSKIGRKSADELRAEALRLRDQADRALEEAEQTLRDEMDNAMQHTASVSRQLYDGAHRSIGRSASQVEGIVKARPVTALATALAIGVALGYVSRR